MVDWVSQAELARRLGVSPNFVNNKVKTGLFTLNKFKQIDYEQASKDYKKQQSKPAEIDRKNTATDPDYWAARTRREMSEANISEIKQQELKNSLVAKESVRRTVHEVFRSLRDSLGVVPRRLAGELSAEDNPEECIKIVDKEIKHVLQAVADEIRKEL